MTFRRPLAAFTLVLVLASSLVGCGRRGPLELPPETQARGAALKAQAAQEQARAPKTRAAPGEAEPERPDPPIPGTVGNRPPDQYPFLLDPLL